MGHIPNNAGGEIINRHRPTMCVSVAVAQQLQYLSHSPPTSPCQTNAGQRHAIWNLYPRGAPESGERFEVRVLTAFGIDIYVSPSTRMDNACVEQFTYVSDGVGTSKEWETKYDISLRLLRSRTTASETSYSPYG